jgi:trimeric autotransporter adhesin
MKPIIILTTAILISIYSLHAQNNIILSGTARMDMGPGIFLIIPGNLTINSENILSLHGNLTVSGNLNNNAGTSGLIINSDASCTGSLIENSGVSATVERFITEDLYHYISTPVTGQPISVLQSGTAHTDFDLFWFDEDYGLNLGPAWIDASEQDGNIEIGMGYTYTYNPENRVIPFTGNTNHGTITEAVTYTYDAAFSTNSWFFGWNLIGNPYPSRINATTFIDENDNIHGTLYFWDEGPNYTSHQNNYSSWNKTGSTSGGGGKTSNGYIGIGQAFMVHYGSGIEQTTSNVSFKQNMRVHDEAQCFKSIFPKLRLNVINEEEDFDEILIGFLEGRSYGFDNKYDGYKLKSNTDLAIYTRLVNDDGHDYAIQAIPPLTKELTVKLGLLAGSEGIYSFNATSIENFNDTVSIFLEDLYEDYTVNLRTTASYNFTVDETGTYNDRFLIKFGTSGVGIEEEESFASRFHVYCHEGIIYIDNYKLNGDYHATVFNSLGQPLITKKLQNDSKNKIRINASTGIYTVRLAGKDGVCATKVFSH